MSKKTIGQMIGGIIFIALLAYITTGKPEKGWGKRLLESAVKHKQENR
ncbi:hypothetical protein ACXWTF_12925 [Thiomicrolovo sp. ZZH C-3]